MRIENFEKKYNNISYLIIHCLNCIRCDGKLECRSKTDLSRFYVHALCSCRDRFCFAWLQQESVCVQSEARILIVA
jgi:hypothetical protein